MTAPVFIAGGTQSDFARHLDRDGRELVDLVGEVALRALADAGLAPDDVDTIHVGNAFGELFTGQAHLGAMPATAVPELAGKPAMRHEAACASGSLAIQCGMTEIEAGRADCVLVLGVEQERHVPALTASRHLGAAAWVGHEGTHATHLWPHLFDRLSGAYERRFGLDRSHLIAIAKKNFANAKANPHAQTRTWELTEAHFADDDVLNPVVEGRVRRHDCSQLTDGAAAVVLVSNRMRERLGAHLPRIAGWGLVTSALPLQAKLDAGGPYLMPGVRAAVLDAYRRAGLNGPTDLDAIETHDCFTITEYMAVDHFGLTEPGRSGDAIAEGRTQRDGALPINPSGGLIGGGHPVGATGVRMLLDASRQVTGRAGGTQVDGARRVATLNLGGSGTTAATFVVASPGDRA